MAEQLYVEVPTPIGVAGLLSSQCRNCHKQAIWDKASLRIVYPRQVLGPNPNADMPDDVLADFNEARSIGAESPRGAAALLRLCVQKICVALGLPGKNINEDIAALVKNGLPELLQQSLDAVRVVGNNAVHPGELDVGDDLEIVSAMFGLVNIIVERMISEPKRIREIYDRLPDGSKAAVERRDA